MVSIVSESHLEVEMKEWFYGWDVIDIVVSSHDGSSSTSETIHSFDILWLPSADPVTIDNVVYKPRVIFEDELLSFRISDVHEDIDMSLWSDYDLWGYELKVDNVTLSRLSSVELSLSSDSGMSVPSVLDPC